ncbi:putative DEAD/DEAH box helicase [Gammaproteobacteria bacterium]
MEQGLGKSALALDEFVSMLNAGHIDGMIVICPNSLKSNWVFEAENWGVPVKVTAWPDVVPPNTKPFIFAVNYEAMLHKGYEEVFRLARSGRVMCVLDESQRIKNPTGKTTKKILSLRNDFSVRRTLSGTPMTNSVVDLYPQLTFISAIRTNAVSFKNRFAVMGGYLGKSVIGVQNEEELREILDQHTFRARKDDWLDLPEQIFPSPRAITLTPEQKKAYRGMSDGLLAVVKGVKPGEVTPILANLVVTQLQKLQQISSGFIIDEERRCHDLIEPIRNPKIQEVRAILDDIPGKAIVFVKHKRAVTLLLDQLKDYGCSRLVGGMSDDEVREEKERFNCEGGNRVLVSQASVGGVGHTLLGGPGVHRCSTTIYFENSFSLGDRLQSEARNHRAGQDRAVVYWDFAASDIDRKIIRALQKKKALVDALLD